MPRPAARLVARFVDLRPGESRSVALATACFFLLLATNYVVKPLRDAMAAAGDIDSLPGLFGITFGVLLALTPVIGAAVDRYPRSRLVPSMFRVASVALAGFWLATSSFGANVPPWLAVAFFVWVSVVNVVLVALFWGFVSDVFRTEQALRLFGFIAAGGTLGAIVGASTVQWLVERLGASQMLWAAVLYLECARWSARRLAARHPETETLGAERDRHPGILEGARAVFRSPFLSLYALYIVLYATTSTFLYFLRRELASTLLDDTNARAAFFATIETWINVGALTLQLTATGAVLPRLGVTALLVVVPLATAIGFGVLGAVPTLAVVAVIYVVRQSAHYAFEKPAREVLWTGQPSELRYKSKAFLDSVVYRGGDALSEQVFRGVRAIVDFGWAAFAAIPLAVGWAVVGWRLGRRARLQTEPESRNPTP